MYIQLQTPASIGVYDERLAVILGYITLLIILAFFSTCRSFVTMITRLGMKDPQQVKWYQLMYKYHAYYWPVFWITFILHVLTALMHTDLPQFGDPDAVQHLYILASGLLSLIALIVLGFSCRIFTGIYHLFNGKSLTENHATGSFYNHHGMYWLVLLASIAVHLVFAYRHIGFWPS